MENLEQAEILLAEDSATDGEMTIRALRKADLADNLVWVRDGAEVLDFLYAKGAYAGRRTARPKLILLDLKMPKIDGIEVLRQIKSDPRMKSIPVVMLTSSAEESDIVRSYDLGVNSYLVKPVEFDTLNEDVAKAGIYWLFTNRTPQDH